MHAIIKQKLLPPIDCFNKQVNLESLYGGIVLLFESARIAMTCLKVISDLLISILSFAYFPSVPVRLILSEPAKSTNSSLEIIHESGFLISTLSIFNSKIE